MKRMTTLLIILCLAVCPVIASETIIYEFPGETVIFDYSFEEGKDSIIPSFLIRPSGITLLKIECKALSDDHTLNIKIVNDTKKKTVYDDIVNFLEPYDEDKDLYPCEFTITPEKLYKGDTYYIELSSPSIKDAKGEIAVSGNISMLTDLAKLNNLGIATEVEAGPYGYVKRYEAAKIMAQAMNMENVAINSYFKDIDNENPKMSSVGAMEGMGIIKGYGDGTFMPDKEITYYEAVKMIVCMLGYEKDAEIEGYPKGYMNTANKLGIILYPGINDRAITLNEISEILYKALDVPLKLKNGYGAEEIYIICDGVDNPLETIRTKYLDIK